VEGEEGAVPVEGAKVRTAAARGAAAPAAAGGKAPAAAAGKGPLPPARRWRPRKGPEKK